VAFEAMHTMDRKMKGKDGYKALKLDMSKAFDRVEWGFLEVIMQKLGFDARWIHLLMTCVCTVSYSVLINGQPYGAITPSRGIRQGDPLSPCFSSCVLRDLAFFFIRLNVISELRHFQLLREE
jgi:hypothetical protein